jgi:hypothetical protein
MGFQPMHHRHEPAPAQVGDADATKPHGQDAHATSHTPSENQADCRCDAGAVRSTASTRRLEFRLQAGRRVLRRSRLHLGKTRKRKGGPDRLTRVNAELRTEDSRPAGGQNEPEYVLASHKAAAARRAGGRKWASDRCFRKYRFCPYLGPSVPSSVKPVFFNEPVES